jgi:hypothetical protein
VIESINRPQVLNILYYAALYKKSCLAILALGNGSTIEAMLPDLPILALNQSYSNSADIEE